MSARTPNDAFRQFISPIQDALGYIAAGRLVYVGARKGILVGEAQRVLLNGGAAVALKSLDERISLRAGFRVRVVQMLDRHRSFACETVEYNYTFEQPSGLEILAFHWTPEGDRGFRTFPHLHIGPAISRGSELFASRIHRLHVPTGVLSTASIVRFAIEELDVQPASSADPATVLQALARLERSAPGQ